GPTNCTDRADHASYWAPALYSRSGGLEPPISFTIYYQNGSGHNPGGFHPYPLGLRIIAGDSHATTPQPAHVTSWHCSNVNYPPGMKGPPFLDHPYDCRRWHGVTSLQVTFPGCWDGVHADSADHR